MIGMFAPHRLIAGCLQELCSRIEGRKDLALLVATSSNHTAQHRIMQIMTFDTKEELFGRELQILPVLQEWCLARLLNAPELLDVSFTRQVVCLTRK